MRRAAPAASPAPAGAGTPVKNPAGGDEGSAARWRRQVCAHDLQWIGRGDRGLKALQEKVARIPGAQAKLSFAVSRPSLNSFG